MNTDLLRRHLKSGLVQSKHQAKMRSALVLVSVLVLVCGYIVVRSSRAAGLVGDLNSDGTVNVFDLSILLSDWGTANATADLNSDGTVNIFDLSALLSHWGQSATPSPTPTGAPVVPASVQICGSSQLQSPWSGSGVPSNELTGGGVYSFNSGQYAGLPTFGATGTNFPAATSAYIVAAGSNSLPNYAYGANTLFWFAPGAHNGLSVEAVPAGVYVGGYSGGTMATLNGGGSEFGIQTWNTHFGANSNNVTIEYLAFTGYTSGGPAAVNDNGATGWVIEHNYMHDMAVMNGSASEGVGVYGNGTIEYNCFQKLGQAGVVFFGANDNTISYNEFDTCATLVDNLGTNGGMKGWETQNAVITHNYLHGTETGFPIWLDTNNTGYLIDSNYFQWNLGRAIQIEVSHNGQISNNVFSYNGYEQSAAGYESAPVYINVSGAVNHPGDNYNNEILIKNNTFWDNWMGVEIYGEAGRNCHNPMPLGNYCALTDTSSFSAINAPNSVLTGDGGGTIQAACTAPCSSLTVNYHYAVGDHIGFSQGSYPYQITSETPSGSNWVIGLSPAITTSQTAGKVLWGQGTCNSQLTNSATPAGGANPVSPSRLGLNSQTMTYFDGCMWGNRNITVSGNNFHFSPTEIQSSKPPANWAADYGVNPSKCYSGSNYTDYKNYNTTKCGFNAMYATTDGTGAYSQDGSTWINKALMSNSSFTGPLSNLDSTANGGIGEAPFNDLWTGNTYDGPIAFRTYMDTVDPTNCGGSIAGFQPICTATVAQWGSVWQQH